MACIAGTAELFIQEVADGYSAFMAGGRFLCRNRNLHTRGNDTPAGLIRLQLADGNQVRLGKGWHDRFDP